MVRRKVRPPKKEVQKNLINHEKSLEEMEETVEKLSNERQSSLFTASRERKYFGSAFESSDSSQTRDNSSGVLNHEDLIEKNEKCRTVNTRNVKLKRVQPMSGNKMLQVGKRVPAHANALSEIKKYQRSTGLLIPRLSFARVCREILVEYGGPDLRVQCSALECLQESAEMYLVQFFEDAYLCTMHAGRRTLMPKDLRLARRIGGRNGFYL